MRQDHHEGVKMLQAQPEDATVLPSQGVVVHTPEIQAQMDSVFKLIVKEGVFSFAVISQEVEYYYDTLGLDPIYFELNTPAQIAKHIHSFMAAKKVATIGRKPEDICLTLRTDNTLTIICTQQNNTEAQDKIDKYMKETNGTEGVHLHVAESTNGAFEGATEKITIFSASRHAFETRPSELDEGEHDLHLTSTAHFQRTKPAASLDKYQEMISGAVTSSKAFVGVFPIAEDSYVENPNGCVHRLPLFLI